MSKYQKLDSALAPTMHDDDYDESFSLYLDDNQHQQQQVEQQQQVNNNDHIRLNVVGSNRNAHMPNGHHKYNNFSNNNIDINSTGITRGATSDPLELDEHTWEVPLLRSSSNLASFRFIL